MHFVKHLSSLWQRLLFAGCLLPALALAQADEHDHLLWQITGKGLSQPSYLYGTIHIIGVDDFRMTEDMQAAIGQSDVLALEIDMSNMMAVSMAMMQHGKMADGQTLEDLLSPEDYELLMRTMFDSLDMNEAMFTMTQGLLPMLQISSFYPKLLDSEMKSYEMELIALAKRDSLEIEGLERMEDQLAMLDDIPYAEQAEALMEFVKDYESQKERIDRMIELYVAEDLDGLYQYIAESEDMAEYQGALLDKRNQNWIPVIEELIQAQPAFIAVGAGHLYGEQGVIELLRQAGYTVAPAME